MGMSSLARDVTNGDHVRYRCQHRHKVVVEEDIRDHKREGHLCGERSCNHLPRNLRLRCKAHLVRHMCRLQAVGIVRPLLRQIKLTIDEGMAVVRHIASKHADLAIGDLARRARVLAATRMTFCLASRSRSHQRPEPPSPRQAFPVRTRAQARAMRRLPVSGRAARVRSSSTTE
jgi:hypothetical protein